MKKHGVGITDIISFIIGALGIIATIISAFVTLQNGFLILYVELLVLQTFLIGMWSYCLYVRKKVNDKVIEYEKKIEKLNIEKQELKILLDDQGGRQQKRINEIYQSINSMIANQKNVSKLNNDFCTRVPYITDSSYHILDSLLTLQISDNELVNKEIYHAIDEFANGLFDTYKRYTANLLNYEVMIEEAYLRTKGVNINVAASIKLFNKPYYIKDSRNSVFLYTSFRDKHTYDKHEREIGDRIYSIDGNVDFVHCLIKDQFIMNNASKDSESYMNEHIDFDTYYNCAIVVAIKSKLADGSYKFLGYLCCDCLNKNAGIEIFDMQSAQILFALAQQYATFLETLAVNWESRVEEINDISQEFLQMIYSKLVNG